MPTTLMSSAIRIENQSARKSMMSPRLETQVHDSLGRSPFPTLEAADTAHTSAAKGPTDAIRKTRLPHRFPIPRIATATTAKITRTASRGASSQRANTVPTSLPGAPTKVYVISRSFTDRSRNTYGFPKVSIDETRFAEIQVLPTQSKSHEVSGLRP